MQKCYKDLYHEKELEIESCVFGDVEIIYFTIFDEEGNEQKVKLSKSDSVDLAMNILNYWSPKGVYINKYKQALMKMSKEDIIKFEEMLEDKDYGK